MQANSASSVRCKGALIVGFLAVAGAILLAHNTPATGYELSIYRATPIGFWIGIAVGLSMAVAALLATPRGSRLHGVALALVVLSVLAVVGIPLLRSYAYYGRGDSLSHLGWARELYAGIISPTDFVYPGTHLIATFGAVLGAVGITQTLQYVPMLLLPALYVIFTGLCVRFLTDSRWALSVGVLAAALLIPINTISLHIMSHPSSQAVLFLPFVVYLLLRYTTSDNRGFPLTTPLGASLAVAGVGLVFVHPQEAMSFLVMLVGIVLLQFAVRRLRPDHPVAELRSLAAHAVLVGIAFLLWTAQHERAVNRFEFVVTGLLGRGPETLSETANRGATLTALGGSFEELFVKLFAVSVVFCLLAAWLMAANLLGRLDLGSRRRNALVTYLTVGLVPPTLGFLLIFFAEQGDHYFRFLGFIMSVVTILGAVALTEIIDIVDVRAAASESISRQQVMAVVGALFVVMLAAQLVAVHDSPYMYQPNKQVTDAEITGHQISFQHHDGETQMMGIRGGPRRFVDAQYGTQTAGERLDFPGYRTGVPDPVFNTNMTEHYDEDRYLIVTQADRDRDLELYRGVRYSQDGFDALASDSRVNRVQDNGEYELYRISSDE